MLHTAGFGYDFFNEMYKRMAEEHGIPTPLNQQLLTMVKGIEHSLQTD